jgi:hypothetical protein
MTRPIWARSSRRALALGAFLAGGACDAGRGAPVAGTLDQAGGTLEATAKDGTMMRLFLSEGALDGPVDFLITPTEPDEDGVARFLVAPAGILMLAQADVTIARLGEVAPDWTLAWVDGDVHTFLPTDVGTGQMRAPTPAIGFPTLGDPTLARLIDVDTTALEVVVADCARQETLSKAAITRATASGSALAVTQAWQSYQSLQARCVPAQAQLSDALATRACEQYDAALAVARATTADSLPAFQRSAGSLLAAVGSVQITGGECDTTGHLAVLDEKFQQLLTFFDSRFSATELSDDLETETDLLQELFAYGVACQSLGLDVCEPLERDLLPDVLDRLREAAYDVCLSTGNPAKLARMMEEQLNFSRPVAGRLPPRGRLEPYMTHARFTYGDLEEDIAYCASTIGIHLFDDVDVPAELLPAPPPFVPGPTPGTSENERDLTVPPGGSLTLDGVVHTAPCLDGSTPADALVAKIGSVELDRAVASGDRYTLATRPFSWAISELQAAAGGATSFDLALYREGTQCGTYTDPFQLYVLHLTVQAPEEEQIPLDPCVPTTGTTYSDPDSSFDFSVASGAAIYAGRVVDALEDVGTSGASIGKSGTFGDGLDYSYTASAGAGSSLSVTADTSGDNHDPDILNRLDVGAVGEATSRRQMTGVMGLGVLHVRIEIELTGEVTDARDGAISFYAEFDPEDEIGGVSTSFRHGSGDGATSISEILVIDEDIDFNVGGATRLYLDMNLQALDGAQATARVLTFEASVSGCVP